MDALAHVDWSLMRAFLAVAQTGSLSAAARSLGASQPTIGRQIRALEQQLGADLFHRRARGFDLTEAGAAILPAAQDMATALSRVVLTAAGRSQKLEGPVRITASVAVSVWHLPAIIAKIRLLEPAITLDIVPSDQSSNLLYREADIAVRMYRPTQLDLVTQYLGEVSLSAFAARTYLDRRDRPTRPEDISTHDFIGFDSNPLMVEGFRAAGFPATRDWFQTRTDDTLTYWECLRAGCGIGFAQTNIGRAAPELEEIDFGFPLPKLPVWLTAHESLRASPRVRRVWDLLAEGLRGIVDA